jgi:hypothetical protein
MFWAFIFAVIYLMLMTFKEWFEKEPESIYHTAKVLLFLVLLFVFILPAIVKLLK